MTVLVLNDGVDSCDGRRMGCNSSKNDAVAQSPQDVRAPLPESPGGVSTSGGAQPKKSMAGLPPNAQGQTPGVMVAAQSQATDASAYFELGALLASVESGAIAPLRGRWLVKLQEEGGVLKRRQDLPPEAFWSPSELRRVATALGNNFGCLFVALSYRWLTKEHPDPDGFHLKIVASVAKLYMGLAGSRADHSPLVKAFSNIGVETDFALFWDFASLHQPPRSDAQTALFKEGLKLSNKWYGHAHTVCWMQSELPDTFDGVAYENSGWCFVEAAISAAIKIGLNRLDLGKRTGRAMDWCYGSDSYMPEARLDCVCAGQRLPPPTPETVSRLLETEKVFTNRADVATVANLYRSFFEVVTSSVEHLDVSKLAWGDEEVWLLAQVLPQFEKLSTLDLSGNQIGPVGAKDIAEFCAVSGSLTSVGASPELQPTGPALTHFFLACTD